MRLASTADKLRRPLLQKGGHAFLLVLGSEYRVKNPSLEAYPLAQAAFFGHDNALPRHHDRRLGIACDRLRSRIGLVRKPIRRNDARHQTGALGFLGIHHPAGQDQVHRPRPTETLLTIDLTKTGDAARLDLKHSGWEQLGPEDSYVRDRHEQGWDMLLNQRLMPLVTGESRST